MKFDGKDFSDLDDQEKVEKVVSLVDRADNNRRKTDWQWYLNHQFVRGNHYVSYNKETNTIQTPPRRKGQVRLVINEVKATIRAIQNYTVRFQPKWEVTPGDTDEETIENARRSGKFLDYYYSVQHLRRKIRNLVWYGLITNLGFWELEWDDEAEGGLGQIIVSQLDPFDVYIPHTAYLEGPKIRSPFIAKVISRNTQQIKVDERYDEEAREELQPDGELAKSHMKSRLIRKTGVTSGQVEGMETNLVSELQIHENEENEKGGRVRVVTVAGGKLLRDEPLEINEYDIYAYQAESSGLEVYGPSMIQHLIPANKALDRLESQILEYNNMMLRGRWKGEKGHGVNYVTTDHGDFIEYNPGRNFEQMDMKPLPLTIHRQTDAMRSYIEDLGGAHQASMGSLPSGARSGKTLEALQAADANNLAGYRESLEDFLAVVGRRVLEIASKKYVTSRVIRITEPEGEGGEKFMKVIGGDADNKPEDAAFILGDNEVNVKIGSWLGYTKEAQRDTILDLAELGVLSAEDVLETFEFPNVSELSEKARSQRLEEAEIQAEIAGRRGGGGQDPQMTGQEQPEGDMMDLADEENAGMMNGEQIPPTQGATPEHTEIHIVFVQSDDFIQNAPPQIQEVFVSHIEGEMVGQQGGQPGGEGVGLV